ncbi:ABC transporter substrate binding protein [Rhodoferax sp.]|uniref:ABC transporter substrate-binding protein n=1 Tax=Rhodoferax sp. TaxID=50421 RepID=UPI0025E81F19|nr:ABC transporter substrate binding protein [Rhodoferax sp.]
MARRLRGILIGLAWCLLAGRLLAQVPGVSVGIVSSQASGPYMEAAQALTGRLVGQGVPPTSIQLLNLDDLATLPAAKQTTVRVWVALGTQASTALAKARLQVPVLSALIPRLGFARVLQETNQKNSARFTAIYLDQPMQRQLALIRLALPQASRVGVLLGPDSWSKVPALRASASANGLTLRIARVDDEASLFAALQSVLDDSDVLLAQADPLVFNNQSIQNILRTSIQAKVPLVAFSPAYVRAGALLALYSTPAQAGTQAADRVLEVLAMRSLPEHALEPDDFEIGVNEQVARVLALTLDARTLRLELRRQESQP